MKASEKIALFGPGEHFEGTSDTVSSSAVTVIASPIHANAVIFPTTIAGESDSATAVLTVVTSGVAGSSTIFQAGIDTDSFEFNFTDLRTISGNTLIVTIDAATAGTLSIVGNQQVPSGFRRSSPEWV